MLRRTFQHLHGIGPVREAALWRRGVRDWRDAPGSLDLEASEAAWAARDWGWFCDHLPGPEHWRILGPRLDQALYLDIETTGGAGPGSITVVGVLEGGEFDVWVAPADLREVGERVAAAPLVVTFAGRGFDIPMLQRAVPGFPEPRAHVDLLPLARRAGIRGGLKGVERHYGLDRDEDVTGLRGHHAIWLWNLWRRGDAAALDRLLRYNRADVEMMPLVGARLCRDLLAALPEDPGVRAGDWLRPAALPTRVVPVDDA